MIGKNWYNAERVRQPGSVVLNAWRAEHGPETLRNKPVQTSAHSQRQYAGAQVNRLTGDWAPLNTSGDAELVTSLRMLRARSRQVCRDNEHAKNALRIVANNIIGTGVGMQATVSTSTGKLRDPINTQIEAAFEAWKVADRCHTAGKLHFHDIERIAVMAVVRDGEVLIRKIKQPFGADNAVPFALEVIEADRLVDNYSQATAPGTGNAIRMGVEVDQWLRPVAYWLYPNHPGDYQFTTFSPAKYIRVPADEIIHLYVIDRWPQTRGEPWFHAALKRINNVGGYEEAEIVAARASAAIMGFRETPESDIPGDGIDDADDVQDGERVMDMSPGLILNLSPGEKFTGFNPTRPNAAMEPFLRHMLRAMAAGVGCSYSALTRDYSQANYSSERASQLEDRDLWRVMQLWFIRSFRARIHSDWLDASVLGGAVQISDYYSRRASYIAAVRFKPRGWSWIDPTKEVQAYKLAVRCGFMTVSDVIAATANGADPEDIFKARAAELDLMESLGLVFDTNPAAVNDKGQSQPTPPTDGEPGEAEGAESPADDSATKTKTETEKEPD
jgi:lambda family phage portal protein